MQIEWTVKFSDLVMIGAVLIAPFLAVYAQRKIDLIREQRNHKLWIFRTLMATRGNRLSLDHVQALNSIELFFAKHSDAEIIEKWNEYLDHFNSTQISQDDPGWLVKVENWNQRGEDLLADLLQTMGKSLGMNFDKVKLKRGFYSPRAHGDDQNDLNKIRKGLVSLLEQKSSLAVKVDNK